MEISSIRGKLKKKGFFTIDYYKSLSKGLVDGLLNSGFELWENATRFIVIKEYQNELQFLNNGDKDQVQLLELLNQLPTKYKNNLYFFLLIKDGNSLSDNYYLEKNSLEKDAFICRKYVVDNEDDLLRVPFINENTLDRNKDFNYEKMFKKELLEIQDVDQNVIKVSEMYFDDMNLDNIFIKFLRRRTKFENK